MGVHGDAVALVGHVLAGEVLAALALGREAGVLELDDHRDRVAVVQRGDVHVLRTDAGHLVGGARRDLDRGLRHAVHVGDAGHAAVHRVADAEDVDRVVRGGPRRLRAAHHQRRGADGGHHALEQRQRVRDHARVEDVVGGRRRPVEGRFRVALGVLPLLHRDGDALLVGEAELVLVAVGDQRVPEVRARARSERSGPLRGLVADGAAATTAAEASGFTRGDKAEHVVGETCIDGHGRDGDRCGAG